MDRYIGKAYVVCVAHMPAQRRARFIYGQAAWMLGTLFVLTLLNAVALELVFIVSFIGFLVIIELTVPFTITPKWRRRLKWLIGIGDAQQKCPSTVNRRDCKA